MMASYHVQLVFAISYFLAILCQPSFCVLPLKVSQVVVDGTTSNECPSQNSIDAEVSIAKEEIQQAIVETVNPFLGTNFPGTCANTSGWTRVTFLNMSDVNQNCPSGLQLVDNPRSCGRTSQDNRDCDSVQYNLNGRTYSNVCGRVIAYQKGYTQAFYAFLPGTTTIESNYVAGVTLTYGAPGFRRHIWTFASALYEQDSRYEINTACPCTNTQFNWTSTLPPFIGNNYFCDTGNSGQELTDAITYGDDPLWDGEGCGNFSTCCQFNNPPWFHTTLPQATSENIELRQCHSEDSKHEDILITLVEIYVK